MKIINILKFYLKYAFYVSITQKERHHYRMGKIKGFNCTGSHDDSYVIHGSARMYYFDETKPPTRDYITYKQYKKLHHPSKSNNNNKNL